MASQDPTEQVNDGPPPRSSEAVARAGPPVFTPARRLGTSTLVEGKVTELHPLSLSRYERRAKGRRPRGAWKERPRPRPSSLRDQAAVEAQTPITGIVADAVARS